MGFVLWGAMSVKAHELGTRGLCFERGHRLRSSFQPKWHAAMSEDFSLAAPEVAPGLFSLCAAGLLRGALSLLCPLSMPHRAGPGAEAAAAAAAATWALHELAPLPARLPAEH